MNRFLPLAALALGSALALTWNPAAALAACDDPGTDICTLTHSDTRWTCDLGAIADTASGTIWAVYDPTGSTLCGYDYCIEGVEGSTSTAFDCPVDAGSLDKIVIIGTDHAAGDEIDLYYGQYDLDAHSEEEFHGLVLAGDGNDDIYGSRSTNGWYEDHLYGHADADDIYGQDGADEIHGGSGDDTIDGGDGGDSLWGGGGPDVICGDDADNYLYGDDGDDTLFGNDASDTKNGGGGTGDKCDSYGTNHGSCDTIQPSTWTRPTDCP